MKITTYIQQIASMFGKSGLLEDLRFARNQYTAASSVLASADKAFGAKFKGDEMKRAQQVFSGVVKGQGGKGIFGYLAGNISNITATIDALEAIVAGEFEDKIAAKGLNYRKANLVQLVDAITFSARYTSKLLTYALKTETAAARDEKKLEAIPTTDLVPYEIEAFQKGLVPYCNAIAVITRSAGDMVERLDQIPDILADDTNYTNLKNTIGETKIDPFLFSTSNFAWNPIRRLRMHRVEAKIARAKEAETELQMAKLRLMQLERARQGKEDPALEREIAYLQSLTDDLTREIAELNED
ncbi:putative virion structural protein [Ralstonia phage RP31]|uniref:Putative virion structural protein n=2 Tax=Ripduovirus RP12 TaxID=2560700 RepID=A0A1L7N163_9CAUD|nr:putative virion structural protein [Ralstonia phage RP12]BAW19217.1 putative virion structural protein [Ralstonia phage RP12]BAW19503.1 putative virion structural protein [Ralstonia phage RP31]